MGYLPVHNTNCTTALPNDFSETSVIEAADKLKQQQLQNWNEI